MPIINLPNNGKAIFPSFSGTLLSNAWTSHSDEYFTQAITVQDMTAVKIPVVALVTTSGAKDEDLMNEWAHIYRVESSTNTLTFYADEAPNMNINIMGYTYKEG